MQKLRYFQNQKKMCIRDRGDLVAELSRSTTSAEQVIKQPFQLIKVSDNGDDTEAGLLAGAEFTACLLYTS